MVRFLSHVQRSLCNKYSIITAKADSVAAKPAPTAIVVPTLREVMQHRKDAAVVLNETKF